MQVINDYGMLIPLLAIIVVLTLYIGLITWKNYQQISGEHLGILLLAQIVFKALQVSATLIVVYWRTVIFEYAIAFSTTYGFDSTITIIGDVFVAIMLVYILLWIPEIALKVIVSRHKKRDRQSSHLRRLLDTSYN